MPGADEKDGAAELFGLKDGSGPAGAGGRGGSDECAGVLDDEEESDVDFRPGGGGYDMMNCCSRLGLDVSHVPHARIVTQILRAGPDQPAI